MYINGLSGWSQGSSSPLTYELTHWTRSGGTVWLSSVSLLADLFLLLGEPAGNCKQGRLGHFYIPLAFVTVCDSTIAGEETGVANPNITVGKSWLGRAPGCISVRPKRQPWESQVQNYVQTAPRRCIIDCVAFRRCTDVREVGSHTNVVHRVGWEEGVKSRA